MLLSQRIVLYKEIEVLRGRPLVTYATSHRRNAPGKMAGDTIREFIDQLDALPADANRIDVLIHSTGGDPLVAWKLMSLMRERFNSVSVLVPYMAFSAATLFALGADEILMHRNASLGPIDPQITVTLPDGQTRRFSYEDVGAFLRFMSKEVEITEQKYRIAAFDALFAAVDPLHIGASKRASDLSTSVGERLLRLHMTDADDRARARTIAEDLNKSFFNHGDAVSRTRAKELGLKVLDPDATLADAMWRIYRGLEAHMKMREVFNPLGHFLANTEARASVEPVAPLQLPQNAPESVVQGAWSAVAQNAINQSSTSPGVTVPYGVINAVLESPRLASEYSTSGELHGFRAPDGKINLSALDTHAGWNQVTIPEGEDSLAGEQEGEQPQKG